MSQKPPIVVPIDADGTACNYLFLLAIAPTGIIYSHQCGGLSCKHNEAEGFLVQVGDDQIRDELYSWFQNEFRGSCMNGTVWTANLIESLSGIISRISCWHTEADGTDRAEAV